VIAAGLLLLTLAQADPGATGVAAGPVVSGDPGAPVDPALPAEEDFSELRGLVNEPILSTASQSLESASAAPATSTSISADDLRRFGIRSLDEAINYLALGMLTQNPLHAVDIGARGVLLTADFGNHVLLLVNGHAMNEQWDGTAYFERGAAIPFELIDHIEIILGPGSVLYGSNAMLGVINIITKRASEWSGYHLSVESELPVSARIGLGARVGDRGDRLLPAGGTGVHLWTPGGGRRRRHPDAEEVQPGRHRRRRVGRRRG
jgi:outer membrane receptor protein involved in Fe transport